MTAIKIIVSSLLALAIQYFADIASVMAAYFCKDCSDGYIATTVTSITYACITFFIVRFCALKWGHLKYDDIGFDIKAKAVTIGITSYVVLFSILAITSLILSGTTASSPAEFRGFITYNALLNKGISTAIGEELIFRGFLFTYLTTLINPILAIIISSIVFVIPHMLIFDADLTSCLIFVNYLSTSLLLTVLYYKTRSLSASIIYHALYNFTLYGLWDVITPGESSGALFSTTLTQSEYGIFIAVSAFTQFTLIWLSGLRPLRRCLRRGL